METDFSSSSDFKIRQDLVSAIAKCQVRGLVQSAAWLSELLSALTPLSFAPRPEPTLADFLIKEYSTLKPEEQIILTLAKTYLDTQEYSRCAHLLSSHITTPQPILYFLYAYARYMAVEKHKTDNALSERKYWNWSSNAEPPENYESYRRALSDLKSDMEYFFMPSQQVTEKNLDSFLSSGIDGYTAYVYALVRNRLGSQSVAVRVLTYVVKKDPTMWPAWSELILLLEDREQLDLLFPTTGCRTEWMSDFFRAKALLRLQEAERALSILQELESKGFRNSLNLQADIAEAYDRLRDLDSAMERFKQLFSVDPYRLSDTDVYSNVLFVKGEHNELAYLARRCAEIDKYRPQTCCVLGNFYGLRGQHDKAVVYFQRALRLQPRYALVWTLIGHEYVELRHLKLATHAYNQAIIHNRHDHRAWYGLGQLYEFVKQPEHALYYYKRAQYLCHTDSRIIVALGEMYEALGNLNAAKKCFWRAYSVGDLEGGALNNLARCFAKCGEESETAAAYTQFIHQCNSRGVSNEAELGQAYRYLANYHLEHKHYNDAVIAVNKCLDFPEIREEAKALCLQLTLLSGSTNSSGSTQPPATAKTASTVGQQLSDRGTGDYELETEEEEERDDGMTAGNESPANMFQQQLQPVTTEKYLPFQISRVRLAPIFGTQIPPVVLTGSFQEEVNSLCAWQYRPSPTYVNNFLDAPVDDSGPPSVLADSADEPRLVCSVVHPGDVQQLKVHVDSQLVFTGSSLGFVGIYRLTVPEDPSDVFSLSKLHFWTRNTPADYDSSDENFVPQDVPISDISVSADASQLYIGDDLGQLTVLDTETLVPKVKTAVSARGFDVATINAIEVIDDACIATANQVGQLNLWDLRSPQRDNLPQRRIIPMGEPRPLVCLSQHPGQPHLLAVGGISNHCASNKKSTSTSYIWDLRAEQHPLSELDCPGTAVWEIKFHPTQPQQLYLATEEAGLVRVQSTSPSESWSYMEGARKKLSAVCAMQKPTACCSVHTFDLLGGLLICGRDNGVLQTIQDSSTSVFSFA